jgi:hypothetical protein
MVGRESRKEGRERARIYTVIECDACRTRTYERKQRKIQEALKRLCKNCIATAAVERAEQERFQRALVRTQREQDLALITAHRAIQKLIHRPNRRRTHGLSTGENQRTYKIWQGMMDRCYNTRSSSYSLYGGRGIKVCERWHDVRNFFLDMGLAPLGHSVERIDPNGDYGPLNCKWIPRSEQSANRRNCYVNRNVPDGDEFQKRKQKLIRSGCVDTKSIPYGDVNGLGWWREFGLYNNPFIYGPMPWKRGGIKHRREEAILRGWFIPMSQRK